MDFLVTDPLTSIRYSIGLPGHLLVETNKSKLFQKLTESVANADLPSLKETHIIYDGNAMLHSMKEILAAAFKLICRKIFNVMIYGDCVFITYQYFEGLVNSMERQRRGVARSKLLVDHQHGNPLIIVLNPDETLNLGVRDMIASSMVLHIYHEKVNIIFSSFYSFHLFVFLFILYGGTQNFSEIPRGMDTEKG